MKELYLAHTPVQDISLLPTSLEVLYLNQSSIGDFSPLLNMLQLRKLYLSRDQVPGDALVELRMKIPELQIQTSS
jgi:Leucine-rich repeat (LRR) protein